MLKKNNATPAKPIAGQWGGDNGKYGIMSAVAFKTSLQAMLDGDLQIQSSGEDSAVVARDMRGLIDAANETTVKAVERYFGMPATADDTPAVEIECVYVIPGGAHNPATKRTNAADFYASYNKVLGPNADATVADGVAFLSKYWGWTDQECQSVLAQHGLVEDNTAPLKPPTKG